MLLLLTKMPRYLALALSVRKKGGSGCSCHYLFLDWSLWPNEAVTTRRGWMERWSKEELDNFVQDLQPIRFGKVSLRQRRKAAASAFVIRWRRTERYLGILKEFRELVPPSRMPSLWRTYSDRVLLIEGSQFAFKSCSYLRCIQCLVN